MKKILNLPFERPKITIFLILATIAGLAFNLDNLKVILTLHELTDLELKANKKIKELNSKFIRGNPVTFVLSRSTPLVEGDLNHIHLWIEKQKLNNSEILTISSPFELKVPIFKDEILWFSNLVENRDLANLKKVLETPWKDSLVGKEGKSLTISIDYRNTFGKSSAGEFDPTPVGETYRDLKREFEKKGFDIHIAGSGAFSYFTQKGMEIILLINFAIFAFVILAFRPVFGTWKSGGLFFSLLGLTNLFVFSLMALFKVPLEILNTSLSILFTISALEDFIILGNLKVKTKKSWQEIFIIQRFPCFCTSLTSIIGFGSLYFADLEIVSRFGVWAGVGAFIEWFLLFCLFPALLQQFPSLQDWAKSNSSRPNWSLKGLRSLGRIKIPDGLVKISLLAFPLAYVGIGKFNHQDSVLDFFDSGHPISKGSEFIKKTKGWEGIASLVITNLEKENFILRKLAQESNILSMEGPKMVLSYLKGHIREKKVKEIIDREYSFSEAGKRTISKNGEHRYFLNLKNIDNHSLSNLRTIVNNLCENEGNCYLASELISYAEFSEKVPLTLIKSFMVSFALVALFLISLVFIKGRQGVIPVLISSFWGPHMMILAIWLFGVKINFVTCIFASVLVGMTGDNAIQYILGGKKTIGEGIDIHAEASWFQAILMGTISLFFLASPFVPNRTLGVLLTFGFLLSVIGDIGLLRGLLERRFLRTKNQGSNQTLS